MSDAFDEATKQALRDLQSRQGPRKARDGDDLFDDPEALADDDDDATERAHRRVPAQVTRHPSAAAAPRPAPRPAPARRFEEHAPLEPEAVVDLPDSHVAMRENRTLFPTTVIDVTEEAPDRLLVSGKNNRKIGDRVVKGAFAGYAVYMLSLEERATCPLDCAVRAACYGNAMQLARRHRIDDPDVFYDRLGLEIAGLMDEHPEGVLVRLHVLGDFPSVEYVANWADLLDEWPKLAVYGYTSRRTLAWDGDEIGDAIEGVKARFPERFRIRWSGAVEREDGAIVIDHVPDTPKVGGAIVCPAQTDATACCSTCALCWETSAARHPIAFIKHGMKSETARAETEMKRAVVEAPAAPTVTHAAPPAPASLAPPSPPPTAAPDTPPAPLTLRRVQPITLNTKPTRAIGAPPEIVWVAPTDLLIEAGYQRDLSNASMKLIRKIVATWDWAKMKPPIVAERDGVLAIIDGQHTAIAAATLGIPLLPVVKSSIDAVAERATAFVAHNRDRVAMTALQIFHAAVLAGDPAACALERLAKETGASFPRTAPTRGKAGQIVAVQQITRAFTAHGENVTRRIMTICVGAGIAPVERRLIRGLAELLTESFFEASRAAKDSALSNAVSAVTAGDNLELRARALAKETGQPESRVVALMIAEALATAGVIAAE